MGIILKENNLIYTKQRHDKFIGSSCYGFDRVENKIYKKEKIKPKIPERVETELSSFDIAIIEAKKEYYGENHPKAIFTDVSIESEKPKRAKRTTYTLNKKKVREKCSAFFGLKKSRKFLAFYSISFPLNFPDNYAFKCFNTVLTRLRKNCRLKSYLWVTERQKNGTIHFHMLTNNYMYVRKVNHYMAKAIETQIKKNNIEVNFDVSRYNGVDVRHVSNNRKALNCYLTKYVSKNSISFFRLPYHSSRDISELFTAETFVNEDTFEYRFIREKLKHIQTLIVDNEWATIEYLNQKQPNGKYFNPPDEWYWLRDFCNEQIYKNHHGKVRFNVLPLG